MDNLQKAQKIGYNTNKNNNPSISNKVVNRYVPDSNFHGDDAEINDYEYYNGRLILNIEKSK